MSEDRIFVPANGPAVFATVMILPYACSSRCEHNHGARIVRLPVSRN